LVQNVGQMLLFARVVETGSFSAAARSLGQSRAAVSKQIASLERSIGAQLLSRTTRSMSLTEVGRQLYARCARIAQEVEDAERDVASLQGAARGRLRVAAPVTFGHRWVAPRLSLFLEHYPEISLDLRLGDRPPDVVEEGFDVAIRIAAQADASLAARRLVPSHHVVCAAPAYLTRRGRPASPDELRDHSCLLYGNLETPSLWRFRGGKSVRVSGSFCVDHGESLRQAVLDGLGIAYVPTFLVGPDVAAGQLEVLLPEHAESRQKIYAVWPRSRSLTPKVRAFVDFLVAELRPVPPWERQ
jgi:DNA-binding transcriptional LysR family regulator